MKPCLPCLLQLDLFLPEFHETSFDLGFLAAILLRPLAYIGLEYLVAFQIFLFLWGSIFTAVDRAAAGNVAELIWFAEDG